MNFHPEATHDSSSYQNPNRKIARKVFLHVNKEWAELDIRPMFREKLTSLMQCWDWGFDDIEERFDKGLSKKIQELL